MSIRVLLADDHAVLRDGLRALLMTSADIEVVAVAGNGRDAVQAAIELKPDVAILDVTMPGLGGIEAASLLRRQCPATRVIMLSMHSSAEHVHRALEAGASGYLRKEDASEEIVKAVRAVHAGRNYLGRTLASDGPRTVTRVHGAAGPCSSSRSPVQLPRLT